MVAEKGEVGALHYGPYIDVEAGTYTVSFDVRLNAPDGWRGWDEVAPDQKLLAETVLIDNTSPRTRFTWIIGNARIQGLEFG